MKSPFVHSGTVAPTLRMVRVVLPPQADNNPEVQLRWATYLRTNDPALTVTGETTTGEGPLAAWTTAGVTRRVAADQTGVPNGFQRTLFEVAAGGVAARFLRLRCGHSGF